MAEAVFWCSALLLVHTYALYPLLLALGNRGALGRGARVPVEGRRGAIQAGEVGSSAAPATGNGKGREGAQEALPRVTLVIAAYNEEAVIGPKLRNCLQLDYPPELLQVVIGSDGSDDSTDAQVLALGNPRVHLSRAPRAGKTTVLNRCIPAASGEIVVLSDANTELAPDAVRQLVQHFRDPRVGAVCGRLRLFNPTRQDYEESAYWSYESFIKQEEGKRGAVVGANGGLYAIRKELFEPLPASTIVDDFVIALRILERGHRVLYEARALAREETTEDYQREFGRRARIAAGNFQALRLVPGLLHPRAGFAAYALWSHKVLRWCAPLLMALALLANLALLRTSGFYRLSFLLQVAFYGLAALGHLGTVPAFARRVVNIPYYFVSMNAALVVGFWRFLRNSQQAAWERTARV